MLHRLPWWLFLCLGLAIIVCAVGVWLLFRPGHGLLRPEEERWVHSVQAAIAKVQEEMPPLPGAIRVYERSSGCLPWKVGGVDALYATDEPWETVRSHYEDRATSPDWSASCDGGQRYDGQGMWLHCETNSPPDDLRFVRMDIVSHPDGAASRLPPGVIEGAGRFGTTVYEVDFYFGIDRSFSPTPKPYMIVDMPSCSPWKHWERVIEGWQPVTLPPAPTEFSYPALRPSPQSSPYVEPQPSYP